jgi:hypothetical protein
MSKDEVAQSLDLVAGNFLGKGHGGQELMGLLSSHPEIAAEVYRELGKHGNSGSASGAVLDLLKKHGITVNPDTSPAWSPGKVPELIFPNTPPAPAQTPAPAPARAPGQPPAAGSRYRYDPATKKMVPVE